MDKKTIVGFALVHMKTGQVLVATEKREDMDNILRQSSPAGMMCTPCTITYELPTN